MSILIFFASIKNIYLFLNYNKIGKFLRDKIKHIIFLITLEKKIIFTTLKKFLKSWKFERKKLKKLKKLKKKGKTHKFSE